MAGPRLAVGSSRLPRWPAVFDSGGGFGLAWNIWENGTLNLDVASREVGGGEGGMGGREGRGGEGEKEGELGDRLRTDRLRTRGD